MRDNVEVRGSGKDATILKPLGRYAMTGEAPHGIDMFYYDGFDDRRYLDNASFYDFTIDGEHAGASANASGRGFLGCSRLRWERVEVRNTDGTGFGADYPVDCVMRCSAIGCGKNATEDGASIRRGRGSFEDGHRELHIVGEQWLDSSLSINPSIA